MKLSYLIIDDEPLAHKVLQSYAQEVDYLQLKKNCYSAPEALNVLHQEQVDFVFLDIRMPKMRGLDMLHSLKKPPKAIITTAYREYAVESFELEVCDYLLKPYSLPRFMQAVERVCRALGSPVSPALREQAERQDYIFVKSGKKLRKFTLSEIIYIQSYGSYCKFFTEEGMALCHKGISEFESLLPDRQFVRIHKSYLVNFDRIESIEGNILQVDGVELPIGKVYRRNLARRIS